MKKMVIIMAVMALFSGFGCSNKEASKTQKQETKSEYQKCLDGHPRAYYLWLNNERVYFQMKKPEEKDSEYIVSVDDKGVTKYISVSKEISELNLGWDCQYQSDWYMND